jgi:hypothetical protein
MDGMREVKAYYFGPRGEYDYYRFDRAWIKNGKREHYFIERRDDGTLPSLELMRESARAELERIRLEHGLEDAEEVELPCTCLSGCDCHLV